MRNNRIELIQGDITTIKADAIVNAASNSLLGGGGVDGAIHRAAGPLLYEECSNLNGCDTGDAKLTKGYDLKAQFVIHTVGPVWHGGIRDEYALLASCYQKSLEVAKAEKIKTIAFPGISTGVYGFPKNQAALVAITETIRFLKKNSYPEKVIFVTYDEDNYKIYLGLLNK